GRCGHHAASVLRTPGGRAGKCPTVQPYHLEGAKLRIRTIKPEFWRSDDIAALRIEDRLLFIGLWSYVDDSGVGEDKLAAICADLFALDMERDAAEVFARVQRGLTELSVRGLIIRYTVQGKRY